METKRKLKLLTSRGGRYVHVHFDDEGEERFPTLADKAAYWQGSDLALTSGQMMNIIREELYQLYGLKELKSTRLASVSYEDFQKLSNDVREVKATVGQLCEEVHELRGTIPKVVVLEEISKEEGRKLVEGYFKEHGQADIEELMLNLKIPVRNIVEIIDDMKKEGKVVPKGEE